MGCRNETLEYIYRVISGEAAGIYHNVLVQGEWREETLQVCGALVLDMDVRQCHMYALSPIIGETMDAYGIARGISRFCIRPLSFQRSQAIPSSQFILPRLSPIVSPPGLDSYLPVEFLLYARYVMTGTMTVSLWYPPSLQAEAALKLFQGLAYRQSRREPVLRGSL